MMKKLEAGQALLVVLLVMAVGTTISLGLFFRTTTDIRLSTEQEESSRAFSAAEAGIEEAFRDSAVADSGSPHAIDQGTYEVTSGSASGGTGAFSLGKIEKENIGTVWLAEHENFYTLDESGFYDASEIRLCCETADTDTPDVEAIILYKDSGKYRTAREFYQADSSPANAEDCGRSSFYSYAVNISLPASDALLALRLRPIGGNALLAVDPPEGAADNSLPSQGDVYVSTGKVGETVRKVRAVKSYPFWPEIFDYVLFSGGQLIK